MGKKAASENLRVVVRVRDLIKPEIELGHVSVVKVDLATNQILCPKDQGAPSEPWPFDSVFDSNFTQKDVYTREVAPLVDSVFQGYNASVFAYGQSGSGKSYTMSNVKPETMQDRDNWGVLPRTLNAVFERIAATSSDKLQFKVSVNYIDLYLGHPYDLIGGTGKPLKVAPLQGGTFHVKGSVTKTVASVEEAMTCYIEAGVNRIEKATLLNPFSSRSHAIFTMHLETLSYEADPTVAVRTLSKFLLVDLAGSEKVGQTGAEGTTAAEGRNINLQLSALARVIDQVVEGNPKPTVRGCDLTMLLADALGGSSRTVMFANCSASNQKVLETAGTLRFASKAKKIKNKPVKQQDPKDAKIEELMNALAEMKERLSGGGSNLELEEELKAKIETLESEKGAVQHNLDDQTIRFTELEEKLAGQREQIEKELQEAFDNPSADPAVVAGYEEELKHVNNNIMDVLLLLQKFLVAPDAWSDDDRETLFSSAADREKLMIFLEDTAKLIDDSVLTTLHQVSNLLPVASTLLVTNRQEQETQALTSEVAGEKEEAERLKQEAENDLEDARRSFQAKEAALNEELESLRDEVSEKAKLTIQLTADRDQAQSDLKRKLGSLDDEVRELEAKSEGYREEVESAATRERQLQSSLEEATAKLVQSSTNVDSKEADTKERAELQHRVMVLSEQLKNANELLSTNNLQTMESGLAGEASGDQQGGGDEGGGDGDGEHTKLLGGGAESTDDLAVQLQQQLRVQHQLQSLRHLQQTKLTDLIGKFDTLKKDKEATTLSANTSGDLSSGSPSKVYTSAADTINNIEVQEMIKEASQIRDREVEDLRSDYEHKLNKLVRKLNREGGATQKKVDAAEKQLAEERETFANQKEELTSLNNSLLDEVQTLKTTLSSAKAADAEERNRLQTSHDRLRSENDRVAKQLANTVATIEAATSKAHAAQKDNIKHEAVVRNMEHNLKEKEHELSTVSLELEGVKKLVAAAQSAAAKAEANLQKNDAKWQRAMVDRANQFAGELEKKLLIQADGHHEDMQAEKAKQSELREKNKKFRDKVHKAETKNDQMILENEWLQVQFEEAKVIAMRKAVNKMRGGSGDDRQSGPPASGGMDGGGRGPPSGASAFPTSSYGTRGTSATPQNRPTLYDF